MAKGKGGFIGQDGLNAPDSPTGVSGSAGNEQVTVSFTAPSDVGGSAITGYRAQSNDGVGASGSSSPITVTGLTNGTSYTFNVWAINAFGYSAPSDASGSVSPAATRALVIGGEDAGGSGRINEIQYTDMSTSGNFSDFGDLTHTVSELAAFASSTRAVSGGGSNPSVTNVISYFAIASLGNASDFGDLTVAYNLLGGFSNSTRGIFYGGKRFGTLYNTIQYVTIASTGNASDFGDGTTARGASQGTASPTRGVIAGGQSNLQSIDYIEIGTTGNASDFGDLSQSANGRIGACASTTRAVFMLASSTNIMEYVTIASTGNSTDFGDLTGTNGQIAGTSDKTLGLFMDAFISGAANDVAKITIASTGNAADYGDLNTSVINHAATSSGHGGLS